jgi:transforming growth factor-beta-induced protein
VFSVFDIQLNRKNNFMKHFRLIFIATMVLMTFGISAKATKVVDIIAESENHTILETAIIESNLEDDLRGAGPFTIFAPTDAAFQTLPEGTIDALLADSRGALTDILLYHTLSGKVMSSDLSDGMTANTYYGEGIQIAVNDEGVFINGAKVTVADIEADNGVVHVLDVVLLPEEYRHLAFPETVVDIATSNDDFSILVAALTREDLTIDFVGALTGEGPFTVFAPTNAAFVALLNELGATSLEDIATGTLEAVLQMHVLSGKVMSTDLSEGLMAETLLGQQLTFSLEGGAKIIDQNGRVSNITAVDIEAQNGVVHVIDTVILSDLRPATVVDIATSNDDFSILVAALTREDLTIDFVSALTGEGPFTVLAPTNAAFAALLDELGAISLDDIDTGTLEAVLQMHVLSGKVMSTDLSEGLTAETLLGQELTFSLEDGAKVIDPNGRESNIVAVDIEVQNGVVHVIDTVILSDLRPATVVDIATSNNDFSILVAALTREDLTIDFVGALTGEGPFTVFAPTNAAFVALLNELGATSLDDIDTGTLEAVLQMHVLSGKVMSTDLSEGLTSETLLGQELTFSLEDGAKVIDPNGRVSNIVAVDIEAQNGVVHVIDTVILSDLRPATVVDIATSNNDFSILVAALTREDLTIDFVGALTGEGPFTVFAPTNAAFAALLDELGATSLDDIDTGTLEAVLQMHVLAGKVMSTDLSEGLTAETLLGQELTFSLEDGAKVIDPNGRVSNIVAVDIEAQNGVVHVIDTVILSKILPATVVDIATSNDDFSILVAALTREDLTIDFVGALTGEGPFTVFAPTNAAFVALLNELGATSLDDIDTGTLEAVLQMHVLSGKVMSTDLSEGLTAETLLGQQLTFSLEGGAKIIDQNGRVSNITAVDIEAQNGVVHVIDTVILSDLRPATVVDIATSNDDFSILVAALTREDLTIDFVSALTGEGPFTVLAPTNAAFAALLDELGAISLDDIDTGTLEAVLQMHVLSGKVMSTDLSEGLTAETLLGQELTFSLEDGAKVIDPNGRESNIVAVDIEAQNGVVHVIDTVILSDLRPATVVDIATSNNDFSILVAALTREDLTIDFVGALTGEGPFTVFAPTNVAFAALLNELGATSLDDIDTGTLEAVLQMHILAGKVMSADLSEGLTAETLLGQELTFSLEDGAKVIDPNGRVSNITAVDIEAQNGVVHVIDTVILMDLTPTNVKKLEEITFDFYPNPANGYITVRTDEIGSTLRIIDISGKMMRVEKVVNTSQRIDLNGLNAGVYFISVESEAKRITQKLIVR